MRTETKLLKPLLQVVAVSLSLFVGWSRIADNKHFLTDILAGFVLGAIFAWFMVSRALAFAIIKPATTTFVQATFSESQFTHLYKTLIDFSAGAPYNK